MAMNKGQKAKQKEERADIKLQLTHFEQDLPKRATKAIEIAALAKRVKVRTHPEYEFACNSLQDLKGKVKALEEERSKAVGPIKQGVKVIEGWFKSVLDPYNEAITHLRAVVEDYAISQDAKMRELQENAKSKSDMLKAEDALPPKITGISFRGKTEWIVEDERKIPDAYFKRVLDRDLIDSLVKKGGLDTKIPGIKVLDGRTVVVGEAE